MITLGFDPSDPARPALLQAAASDAPVDPSHCCVPTALGVYGCPCDI